MDWPGSSAMDGRAKTLGPGFRRDDEQSSSLPKIFLCCPAHLIVSKSLLRIAPFPVTPDQSVGGTVVVELRLRIAQLRDHFLRELLAQFHAPLVEGVDIPDRALHEDAVLVQRHQRAERIWRQPFAQDRV